MHEIETSEQLSGVPDGDFVLVVKSPHSRNRLHKATCHHVKSYQSRSDMPHTNSIYFHIGRNEEQPLLGHRAKKCRQCFTKQSNQTLGWKTFGKDTL